MENNPDKAIRDKLSGLTQPFDPQAWQQMEAMLDKKRKPRGFIGWWFGGIAACLLLGAGLYGYYHFAYSGEARYKAIVTARESSEAIGTKAERATNHGVHTTVAANNNFQPASDALNGRNVSGIKPVGEKVKNSGLLNTGISSKPARQAPESATSLSAKAKRQVINKQSTKALSGGLANAKQANTPARASANKRITTNDNSLTASNVQNANSLVKSGSNMIRDENRSASKTSFYTDENTVTVNEKEAPVTNISSNREVAEPIAIYIVKTGELSGSGQNLEELEKNKGDDEINLKKLNKKVFRYSLGAAANITGATLGKQTGAKPDDFFYSKPSYMLGLTHDFLFLNCIAISNSILFSQTSFKVFQAKTTLPEGLNYYTSSISELAIPVGIKGYIINTKKCRFYAGAGIINHIKLKETFNYSYNYVSPGGITAPANNYLPPQTQFNNNPAINSLSSSGYTNPGTSDFGINHARRYYASFYASAGAEYMVQKHIMFFTEPLFYMALQKVGVQDKYKYNLGLSGGIRYGF